MLYIEDTKIELKCQGFEAKQIEISPNNDKTVVFFQSTRQTSKNRKTKLQQAQKSQMDFIDEQRQAF